MKKVFSVALAASLALGSFGMAKDVSKLETNVSETQIVQQVTSGSPVDLGIANYDRLIEMLKKEGRIAENATPAEAEEAVRSYLKVKSSNTSREKGELHKEEMKLKEHLSEQIKNNGIFNGKGLKKGHAQEVSPVKEEGEFKGQTRKDKVLVLLIDYPDHRRNNISAEETDMHYDNYSKEHYQNMLFGENGYIGPDGETKVSMKQYYEQQSGGSYTVDGEIAGWYTAQNPAAYYGGNYPTPDGSDANARGLVYEALVAASQDPTVNLANFDQEDRYDLDGDGNYREPDGMIDHLMVIHAGVGEEAGGGRLGGDAIWSHRWNLGNVTPIPNTSAQVGYWGGGMAAYDYTIEPEDGAAGVFAHEYGHDLGLPDEYDTDYTGKGEPISSWSIMSSGSWAGKIKGTEPTGFSPYAKEFLQGTMPGSKWQTGAQVNLEDITSEGLEVLLDQANTKGTNNDVLKINLPDKENVVNTPVSGQYEYFSGSGNSLDNSMATAVDLTNATNAKMTFKAWFDIEEAWDYGSVFVIDENGNRVTVEGNITTSANPNGQNPGFGITGSSNGWVDAEFDLSQFAGQNITVGLNYWTDGYVKEAGLYADDIAITVDGNQVVFDNAEAESVFDLYGFAKDTGKFYTTHYYLVEWRNHAGVDQGLKHINVAGSMMSYEPGMVIWYVDDSYENNWVGIHPGDGFVGVVDADQHTNIWDDGAVASTKYQIHDAAFSLESTDKMLLDLDGYNMLLRDNFTNANPLFDDSFDYSNKGIKDAGRSIPNYGLKIRVVGESSDKSVGKILLYK